MNTKVRTLNMRRAVLPLLAALVTVSAWAAPTNCPQMYVAGMAPDIVNTALLREAHELCFTSFGVMHSGLTRTPLWSAEHLTRQSISQARKMKREDAFHVEDSLPASERSDLSDYVRSGLNRGHMTPSADAPSSQAQFETFSLANMVPQNQDNNQNLWEGIESAVRTLALQSGDLYVITGPLFLGSHFDRLHNRVLVPTNLFKVVYDPQRGQAAAYLVQNREGNEYKVVSIAELNKIAGIDFLPQLSAASKQNAMDLPAPIPHGQNHKSGPSGFSERPPSLSSLIHLFKR